MGRETFTDHEGNEAPDFEVEEEEEEEAGGKAKSEKKAPSTEDDDAEGDDDAAAAKKAGKSAEGDEEEEIEDEEDEEKARLADENERLRAQAHKDRLEKTESEFEQAKYLSGALTKQIESIRASIVEARKDEDVEKQAKLENELDQAKDALAQTNKLVEESGGKLTKLKESGPEVEGGSKSGAALTPKARDWLAKNRWMNEQGNEVERMAVMVIDKQLAAEGLNRNTDRYYAELSRRVAKKFPGLKVRHLDGKDVVKSTRKPGGDGRKGVHTQAGTSGKSGSAPTGKPKFEAADRVKMRKWGLDPANKEHVKHWLRSKGEIAAQEARRAAEEG